MKPFIPGRPIEASVISEERRGESGHHALEPAVFGNQPRVPAVRQHADDQEQPAGADAVRQHLVDRALHALQVHRADAEHDEARGG